MTRAKRELIISYSLDKSKFIQPWSDWFVQADWSEHSPTQVIAEFTLRTSTTARFEEFYENQLCVDLTGKEFLYTKKAIGVPVDLQDKLVELIAGIDKASDKKQVGWRNIRHALEFRDQHSVENLFGKDYQQFRKLFYG